MFATLLIVFREVIEAGLVVGIVLAATRGLRYRHLWVGGGVLAGLLGACIIAVFAREIGETMQGMGQEIFNATILLLAVLMLAWHNIWMSRHGRVIAAEMKDLGAAVASGKRSMLALAMVIGVAVLREGAEVVLFLYGVVASDQGSKAEMLLGGTVGLVLGGVLSAMMYLSLVRIPLRYLFSITSGLICLLAAGMAAQAVAFLQQAGVITVFDKIVWDSSAIIPEKTIVGKILQALVGYVEQPSEMQIMVYVFTLVAIWGLMRLFAVPHSKPQANYRVHQIAE
ncbi:MAG: FTR1 family iron permease [Alphaproteobacteria bacterium]